MHHSVHPDSKAAGCSKQSVRTYLLEPLVIWQYQSSTKPCRPTAEYHTTYVGCPLWAPTRKAWPVPGRDGCFSVEDEFQTRVTKFSISRALAFRSWSKKTAQQRARERNADLRDTYFHNISEFYSEHLVFVNESGCDRPMFVSLSDSTRCRGTRMEMLWIQILRIIMPIRFWTTRKSIALAIERAGVCYVVGRSIGSYILSLASSSFKNGLGILSKYEGLSLKKANTWKICKKRFCEIMQPEMWKSSCGMSTFSYYLAGYHPWRKPFSVRCGRTWFTGYVRVKRASIYQPQLGSTRIRREPCRPAVIQIYKIGRLRSGSLSLALVAIVIWLGMRRLF